MRWLVVAFACSQPAVAPPAPRTPIKAALPHGPATIAENQQNPDYVAVDADDIYWATDDSVWHAPRAGGAETLLAGPLGGQVGAMAADATSLYVTLNGDGYRGLPKGHGKLLAIAKHGGATRTLAEDSTWAPTIAVDDHDIYVGNSLDSISFDTPTGQVVAYPKAGGAARVLAAHQTAPQSLAVDRDAVYWANYGGATEIRRVDKHGGTPTDLARALGTPAGLTLTDDAVLIATVDVGVQRVAKSGGPVATLFVGRPMSIRADPTTAYVRTNGGLLLAVPLTGGPTRVVSVAPTMFYESLVVDGDDVYWTSREKGTVRRAARTGTGPIHVAAIPHTPGALVVGRDRVYYFDTDSGAHADVITSPQDDLLYAVPRDGTTAPRLVHTTHREPSEVASVLAIDGDTLFLSDPDARTVLAVPRAGGKPDIVYRSGDCVTGLAVDTDAIYVADCTTGVRRVERHGHAVSDLVRGPIGDMLVVGDSVFVVTDAAIMRAPVTGGTPAVFVQQTHVAALAADATHLYWTIDRTVFRTTLAPPHTLERFAVLSPIDDASVRWMAIDRDGVVYVASHGGEFDPGRGPARRRARRRVDRRRRARRDEQPRRRRWRGLLREHAIRRAAARRAMTER